MVYGWGPGHLARSLSCYLAVPPDVLFDRIQRRGQEKPPIQRDAVFRWSGACEAPTQEEMALFDEPLIVDPLI